MARGELANGQKEQGTEGSDEDGSEKSRPMIYWKYYFVKSLYSTSIRKIDAHSNRNGVRARKHRGRVCRGAHTK